MSETFDFHLWQVPNFRTYIDTHYNDYIFNSLRNANKT